MPGVLLAIEDALSKRLVCAQRVNAQKNSQTDSTHDPYLLEMDADALPFLDFTIFETISETANHKSRGRVMVYS